MVIDLGQWSEGVIIILSEYLIPLTHCALPLRCLKSWPPAYKNLTQDPSPRSCGRPRLSGRRCRPP